MTLIHFFKHILALWVLTFLCAKLLDLRKESYVYNFIGKNPSASELEKRRTSINADWGESPFETLKTFLGYFTLSFGYSDFQRSSILKLLKEAGLVSLSISAPSLILGFILSLALSYYGLYGGKTVSKVINFFSTILNSLHPIALLLVFQVLLCSQEWLGIFPVQGWRVKNLSSYFYYAAVPIMHLSVMLGSLYYEPIRSGLNEERKASFNTTFLALGVPFKKLVVSQHSKKALIIILSHSYKLAPLYLLSGNILVESCFNIPGLGSLAYQSCLAGDKKTLLALVWCTGIFYFVYQSVINFFLQKLDPREERGLS